MGLTQTVLRSRALAALASPHGVDRYLEQVNPMWAAREVRARVVDVPPRGRRRRPPAGRHAHAAAHQHLAGPPRRPARAARRRARRCPAYDAGASRSPAPTRAPATGSRSRCGPTRTGSRVALPRRARRSPAQLVHLSQAEGDFVLPDQVPDHVALISGGSGITPVMSMLRASQRRTHRGRVTFVHYAQSPDAPDLRRGARPTIRALRLRHRRPPAAPRARRPRLHAEWLERLVPGFRDVPTWRAARPAGRGGAVGATTAPTRCAWSTSSRPRTGRRRRRGRRHLRPFRASPPPTPARRCSSRPRPLGLTPEYGCRMGICFSCTARKTEGTVRNVLTGAESSLPDEDIQICVSAPLGDCVVDL